MERVRDVKMTVLIETDRRTVKQEFGCFFDLKMFVDSFFLNLGDQRSGKVGPKYALQRPALR